MASEIRVNSFTNRSGLSTVSLTDTGVIISGIVTATNLSVNSNNYPSAGPLSNRNILINGGMTVCQRFAINTTNNISNATHTYHVDRFKAYNDNDGVLQGEWVNTEFPEGFRYSLKYTPSTADTSIGTSQQSFISYVIEEKDFERFRWGTSDAQQLTLSFKVKTNKAGTYCVSFFNANTFNRYYITEVSITDTTNWNDVTITVPGDTTGTWSMMRINWALATASNLQGSADTWGAGALYSTSNQVNFMDSTSNEFYLTGVQLEVGSVATPFEHRSYGDELARCLRYFFKPDCEGAGKQGMMGISYAANTYYIPVKLPVPMRVAPSVVADGGALWRSRTFNTNAFSVTWGIHGIETTTSVTIQTSGGSITTGTPFWFETHSTSGCRLEFTAEL